MTNPQQIEAWIRAGLACDHLSVQGDGQHFEAVIVSPEFRGLMRVAQHQLVYRVLGERMIEVGARAVSAARNVPSLSPQPRKSKRRAA